MSKRYTDTEKWKKQWFRALTTVEKSAWFFITEQCDNVGVWDADKEAAEFMIGDKVDWKVFIEKVHNNIEILDNGKWWLKDFCKYQYTDLSPKSKSPPIISHIKLLKKHGLYERVMKDLKGIESLNKGLKEKVKTKVKNKEKVKEYISELPIIENESYEKEEKPQKVIENMYFKLFGELFKDVPNYNYSACRKLINKYLKDYELEKIKQLINIWFYCKIGEWHGYNFLSIQKDWNRLLIIYKNMDLDSVNEDEYGIYKKNIMFLNEQYN